MLQHEYLRRKNEDLMTDVYDGQAWKDFMGECKYPVDRIGLISCGDGIPAFAAGTHSLKPWVHKVASLPPGVRNKIKYMLLWMLMHESIKAVGQRKYFNFALEYEFNELHYKGIDGIKVKIFTITMDTKGREEVSGNVCSLATFTQSHLLHLIYTNHVLTCRNADLSGLSKLSGVYTCMVASTNSRMCC